MNTVEGQPGAQLVIISGPSGVGKDTIIDAMRLREPVFPRRYVVTVTTRERRSAEVEAESYYFLDMPDYERLRDADGLLEASEVHGNCYGTPRDQVQSALGAGRDAVLKIDVQGAHKVHAKVPEALLIFVVPPSLEALKERIIARGVDTDEERERRWRDASLELARQDEYDHVVVNETGRVRPTAQEIDAIIMAEHRTYADRRICV